MGTSWSLRFDNPHMIALDKVNASVQSALDRVVSQMSTWESDSAISRFNRAEAGSRHALEPEFNEVLTCALKWAAVSGGALDPTIGALVALWGFGAHAVKSLAVPSPASLAEAHAGAGWQHLAHDPGTHSLIQPGGISLDLSGVAKGFAVDHAAVGLKSLGLSDFLVEVGGELHAAGRRPGGNPWQVMIEPSAGMSLPLMLSDVSVATSGDRWHAHEHNGRRWSHTLDPRSGHPSNHALASVTVLHRECMQADALATALTVLGPHEGLAFARHHGIAALFVCRDSDRPTVLTSLDWPQPLIAA